MKIGITFDLKSEYLKAGFTDEEAGEFDREDTIEAIETELQKLGHKTERIGNIKQLAAALLSGNRWDLVFNIAEGMYGVAREAQVPALLDAYNIPYTFSDAMVMALSLHKGFTKSIIRDAKIPTADFINVNTIDDVKKINLPYPLFVKPAAEGTGKGIDEKSVINNPSDLEPTCRHLLEKYKQPVLVETYLPGREFTVGIVGTGDDAKSIGALEVILREEAEKNVYSYVNKEKCEDLVIYKVCYEPIARECEEVALQSWKALNCRDAGRVDVKLDKNDVPNFLEVNPLAGIHPLHSDLPILATQQGISYSELIKMIMNSATKRIYGK